MKLVNLNVAKSMQMLASLGSVAIRLYFLVFSWAPSVGNIHRHLPEAIAQIQNILKSRKLKEGITSYFSKLAKPNPTLKTDAIQVTFR